MNCINDFEDVGNYPVVGLIEYLNWLEEYKASDREGQLSMLFCAAFDVDDSGLKELDDDLIADGIIRSNYCYDDFVNES